MCSQSSGRNSAARVWYVSIAAPHVVHQVPVRPVDGFQTVKCSSRSGGWIPGPPRVQAGSRKPCRSPLGSGRIR
eukprot:gene12306-biopygen19942